MKVFFVACFLFLGGSCIHAAENPPQQGSTEQQAKPNPTPQATSSDVTPAQTKIDPFKAADIQRLMDVAGMKTIMTESWNSMILNLRPTIVKALPAGDYRDKLVDLFIERFRSKLTIQQFLDMAAAAYDKYLSDEDIKGLIEFYGTPLGQKTLTILPKLTVELQTEGMHAGEQAGRESMTEVLAEHPDLAKALQEASH
jgi:uncharacterized protein